MMRWITDEKHDEHVRILMGVLIGTGLGMILWVGAVTLVHLWR